MTSNIHYTHQYVSKITVRCVFVVYQQLVEAGDSFWVSLTSQRNNNGKDFFGICKATADELEH